MAKTILVVDDERHIVRLVQVNLERAGYEVTTAYDGVEALEAVEAEIPDMIILDVMMPRMDGFEALKSCVLMIRAKRFLLLCSRPRPRMLISSKDGLRALIHI